MLKDIDKTSLEHILPLLKQSYSDVTLDDEVEYFPREEESLGWCYFEKDESPSSFLRYFIQGESPKFATFEFIISDNSKSEFNALSDYCFARANLLENIMQRFELNEKQKAFIPNLEKFGFNETIIYLTFQKDLSNGDFNHLIDASASDFKQINECLSCFQIFSNKKLQELVESKSIHYLKIDNEIVSVAWIKFEQDTAELTEIATRSDWKNKGYAKTLLNSIEKWCFAQGYKKIFLKVKEENLPAVNLYKSLNYSNNVNLKEYWVYKNRS
ncbi:MAG: GNAT family N-acetyltransferase [Oligoflexia bacterium]|nr:GNAT family N-acetyltransferase [Oligoflexia bacterium]